MAIEVQNLLAPDLREMLEAGDTVGLREFCEALHPATVADILVTLEPEQAWQVLAHTSPQRQAEIFQYLPEPYQHRMIEVASRERMAAIIEAMDPDDRVDLLKSLDSEAREAILPLVARAEREDIRRLLQYPEDSVGSVMTTDYVALPEETTAGEALARLRLLAPDRETIYYVYVVNRDRRLVGVVSLRQLILAHPQTRLRDLMTRDIITVRVDEDKEVAARTLARYDFIALPVVDAENRLVGIVTHDDVMDVLVEAATEDVHRLGGVEPLAESYMQSSLLDIAWKRGVWLTILFVAELATRHILAWGDEVFRQLFLLYAFLPLIMSSGGNSGSQSATLITRALALGEIGPRDWWRVLWRESLMGLLLGLLLGGLAVAEAMVEAETALELIPVVASTLAAVVLCGTLIGSLMPLVLSSLKLDPGIASSPFVASVMDIVSTLVLISVAQAVLFATSA